MSKQVKRKITVELPKAKELLKNRLSVFDRLGTKKQPKGTPEQTDTESKICRQWSQQGTCAYGKSCKYASTHKLISPSKQRATKNPQETIATKKGEEVNKRLHSSVVVRTGAGKSEASQWTDNDLECADADALEKRRQQLQRELEAQMKMESKKPASTGVKKEIKKHKSPTSSSSSASSSGSSSSSDDSSSSSSTTSHESRSKVKRKLKNKRASSSSSESGHKKKAVKIIKSSSHKPSVKSMKKSTSISSLKKKLVDKSSRKKSLSPISRSRKRSLTPPQKSRSISKSSQSRKLVRSPKSDRKTPPLHSKEKLRHEKEREKDKMQISSKSDLKAQQRGRSRDRKTLKPTTSESRSLKNASRQRSNSARRNMHVRVETKRKTSTERKASPAKSRTSGCGSGSRRDKTPGRDDRKQAISSSDRNNRRNDLKDRKHNDRDNDRDRERRERERVEREQAREKEREEALARCQERQRERDRVAKREQELSRDRNARARSRGGLDKPDRDKPAPRLLPRPGERALALAQATGNAEKLAVLDRTHGRGSSRDRHRDRDEGTRDPNTSGNNISGGAGYHHHHHQTRRNTPPSPRSPPPMVVRDRDRDRDRERERDRDRVGYDVSKGVSMGIPYDDDVMEGDSQAVTGRRHGYDSPFDRERRREDSDRYIDRYDDRRMDTADDRTMHHWDRARSHDNRSRSGGRGLSQNVSPRHMAGISDWREHSPMMMEGSRWTPPHGHYDADRDRDSIHDHRMWPERDIRDQHHRPPMGDRERDRDRDVLCDRDRDRVLPRGVGGWDREWPQDRIPIAGELDDLPAQQSHPYRCHESPSISLNQKSLGPALNKDQILKRPHRDDIAEISSRIEDAKKKCLGKGTEMRDSLVDEDDLSEISDDADEILNREDEIPDLPTTNDDKEDSHHSPKVLNQSGANESTNSSTGPVATLISVESPSKLKQEQQTSEKLDETKNSIAVNDVTSKNSSDNAKSSIVNDVSKTAVAVENMRVLGDATAKASTEGDSTIKTSVVTEDDVMDSLDFEEISDEELEEESKVKGLSDVLGVDWASLVRESKPISDDPNLKSASDATNPDLAGENSSKRLWRYEEILLRVGVSVEMAGHEFASKILKDIDTYQSGIKNIKESKNNENASDDKKIKVEEVTKLEPPKIQASVILHPIASMQVASRQKAKAREELFSINSGQNRYCRALSARRDLAMRRQLCDLLPYQDGKPSLRPCPNMFQATLKLLEEKI